MGVNNFGDLHSVGNCHEECLGCIEPRSAVSCFTCKHLTQSLRNRAGFKYCFIMESLLEISLIISFYQFFRAYIFWDLNFLENFLKIEYIISMSTS